MVLISCLLEKLANAHCSLYFNSLYCVHTHTHSTIGLCSSCQNATKHLMENQLIYCIIKNVIYKYPPSFLTLHAFYKLVCYTVLIEAMCAAIFPHKTTTTVCLGFCFHTSSMVKHIKQNQNPIKKRLILFQAINTNPQKN